MTKKILIQAAENMGTYSYAQFDSEEAAWEEEKTQSWVKDKMDFEGCGLDACRAEFMDTLFWVDAEDYPEFLS